MIKEEYMEQDKYAGRKPDPERIQFMKMLPRELKEALTIEEIQAIHFEDVWPDSLQEKLKDFIADE